MNISSRNLLPLASALILALCFRTAWTAQNPTPSVPATVPTFDEAAHITRLPTSRPWASQIALITPTTTFRFMAPARDLSLVCFAGKSNEVIIRADAPGIHQSWIVDRQKSRPIKSEGEAGPTTMPFYVRLIGGETVTLSVPGTTTRLIASPREDESLRVGVVGVQYERDQAMFFKYENSPPGWMFRGSLVGEWADFRIDLAKALVAAGVANEQAQDIAAQTGHKLARQSEEQFLRGALVRRITLNGGKANPVTDPEGFMLITGLGYLTQPIGDPILIPGSGHATTIYAIASEDYPRALKLYGFDAAGGGQWQGRIRPIDPRKKASEPRPPKPSVEAIRDLIKLAPIVECADDLRGE